MERFLAAVGPRAGLVELLAGDAAVLGGLARLCAGGDLLTQLLITQPELVTALADPRAWERPKRARDFRAALAPVFAPGLAVSEQRDRLRQLKQAEERSEEHTSELQSRLHLVCRLLLEKKKKIEHMT